MKKFKFSMQNILNVRKSEQEAREMDLAKARVALKNEEEKLDTLNEIIYETMLPERVPESPKPTFFIQRERYLRMLKRLRKKQEHEVLKAKAEANSCLERVKAAILEVRKMEKASDRQFREWNIEFRRDEQKTNDETGNTRAFFKKEDFSGIQV